MISWSWKKRWKLIKWFLLMKITNNKEFEYYQPKAFLLYPCFSEENKAVHLQPYLPCSSNNQPGNNTWRVLRLNKSVLNSNSLQLLRSKKCCNWWIQELCACKLSGNPAIFWTIWQLPKTYYCEFYIKFWPELFFSKNWLTDIISLNYSKSAVLKLRQ